MLFILRQSPSLCVFAAKSGIRLLPLENRSCPVLEEQKFQASDLEVLEIRPEDIQLASAPAANEMEDANDSYWQYLSQSWSYYFPPKSKSEVVAE